MGVPKQRTSSNRAKIRRQGYFKRFRLPGVVKLKDGSFAPHWTWNRKNLDDSELKGPGLEET